MQFFLSNQFRIKLFGEQLLTRKFCEWGVGGTHVPHAGVKVVAVSQGGIGVPHGGLGDVDVSQGGIGGTHGPHIGVRVVAVSQGGVGVPHAICSRNFQNVKLRLDYGEI